MHYLICYSPNKIYERSDFERNVMKLAWVCEHLNHCTVNYRNYRTSHLLTLPLAFDGVDKYVDIRYVKISTTTGQKEARDEQIEIMSDDFTRFANQIEETQ